MSRRRKRRRFAARTTTVAKHLPRGVACARASRKLRGDFRGCVYNPATGKVTLR